MDLSPVRTDVPPERREQYENYLCSAAWRRRRDAALRAAHWRCEECHSGKRLQVHHRTYERLGAELPSDLEVLCADCHEGYHERERSSEQLDVRIYTKLVYEALKARAFTCIADLAADVKQRCADLKLSYTTHVVAKAIHQASAALPTTSKFHRTEPDRGRPPAELRSELTRADVVETLEDMRRRGFVTAACIKTMPALPKDDYDADVERANRMRQQLASSL